MARIIIPMLIDFNNNNIFVHSESIVTQHVKCADQPMLSSHLTRQSWGRNCNHCQHSQFKLLAEGSSKLTVEGIEPAIFWLQGWRLPYPLSTKLWRLMSERIRCWCWTSQYTLKRIHWRTHSYFLSSTSRGRQNFSIETQTGHQTSYMWTNFKLSY